MENEIKRRLDISEGGELNMKVEVELLINKAHGQREVITSDPNPIMNYINPKASTSHNTITHTSIPTTARGSTSGKGRTQLAS